MKQPRILVVDDDPRLSNLVRCFLERAGRFAVRVENRSAQALAAAREFIPDVILLDVNMPGKDGGDVASEILGEGTLRHSQILYLTSLVSPAETGGRAIIRGGMRFLSKPVNATMLLEAVDQTLARERRQA